MSENFNSHIACEGTDNDINWVCKVCKDLPNYAGMYLYQREREKNQLKNVKDRRADLILLKYYYAFLYRASFNSCRYCCDGSAMVLKLLPALL